MKKELSLVLICLAFTITLAGCKVIYTDDQIESLFTETSNSYGDLLLEVSDSQSVKEDIFNKANLAIKKTEDTAGKLKDTETDLAVDVINMSNSMNKMSLEVVEMVNKNKKNVPAELERSINEQTSFIANNYFEGRLPESFKKIASNNRDARTQTFYKEIFNLTADTYIDVLKSLEKNNMSKAVITALSIKDAKNTLNNFGVPKEQDTIKVTRIIKLMDQLESMGTSLAKQDFNAATEHSKFIARQMFDVSTEYFDAEFSDVTQQYLDQKTD